MQKLLAVYPVILLAFLGFDRLNFSTAQSKILIYIFYNSYNKLTLQSFVLQ